MLRYTIYSDKAMTKEVREINTDRPEVVNAVKTLLKDLNGIHDMSELVLPYRFEIVGVVIHEV